MQKVRANIHLGNIWRNAQAFKSLTGVPLCAVVKANAYGHGAEETVSALSSVADTFAVALVEEGIAIRQAACGKDILIFTPPLTEEDVYLMASNRFIASIPDMWTARLVSAVCRKYRLPIRVHLKINTGMNRYGMPVSRTDGVCKMLLKEPFVRVTGIYSHLYDQALPTAYEQRELFSKSASVCRLYYPNAVAHLSATYGSLLGKDFAFGMVRVGLGLYGYLPQGLPEALQQRANGLGLQKAMQVSAAVAANRNFTFGGAGYGEPIQTNAPKALHTLRIGYADGVLRKRGNGLFGAERQLRPTCMDVCVRRGKAKRGEWQTVLEDADEVARRTGTVSYEVLCAATRRAEFIYDND